MHTYRNYNARVYKLLFHVYTFLEEPAAFLDPGATILQAIGGRGRLISGSLMIFRRRDTAVDDVFDTCEFAHRRAKSIVRQPTTAGKKNTTKGPLSFSVQLITHMLKYLYIVTIFYFDSHTKRDTSCRQRSLIRSDMRLINKIDIDACVSCNYWSSITVW